MHETHVEPEGDVKREREKDTHRQEPALTSVHCAIVVLQSNDIPALSVMSGWSFLLIRLNAIIVGVPFMILSYALSEVIRGEYMP